MSLQLNEAEQQHVCSTIRTRLVYIYEYTSAIVHNSVLTEYGLRVRYVSMVTRSRMPYCCWLNYQCWHCTVCIELTDSFGIFFLFSVCSEWQYENYKYSWGLPPTIAISHPKKICLQIQVIIIIFQCRSSFTLNLLIALLLFLGCSKAMA